jgi:hypothetical protein
MAVLKKPLIDNLELTIQKNVANAVATITYDINWTEFAKSTDLPYREEWSLVGVDPGGTTTIYTGPIAIGGISPNGASTTSRTKEATIAWADLDEDPNGLDEISAVVTLVPLLPTAVTAQSAEVVVSAP